jgi:LmbE family N-acetylglucosaminyl deacetylase
MLDLSLAHPLSSVQRVLCLGAHCDDIEIGCGGAILELAASGRPLEIYWVVFSSDPQREKEARTSAALFTKGIKRRRTIIKKFKNGFFPYVAGEIKEFFEELKMEYAPDLIFTHCRDDRHQDHRTLCELTWNTFRNHFILEYEIPKYDGDLGSPNCFIPVDLGNCRRKTEYLLKVFGTQKNKHWFTADTFEALMRIRGLESCSPTKFAEAFYGRKLVLGMNGRDPRQNAIGKKAK